jgi:FHS family L-fucose permease-like MFS transporter
MVPPGVPFCPADGQGPGREAGGLFSSLITTNLMATASLEVASSDNPVVPRQYVLPFALVTSLFALWGFANDVTNPMVKAFQQIFLISTKQSSLVQTAFYGGYATMAIPAALVIRKVSFKAGIIVGLALYAAGALLFIPASLNMQFWLFLVALYILTFGLAFLETSANPYILSMGPEQTATRRLNLAQAFNPLGSIVGMFVASMLVLPSLGVSQFRAQQISSHPEYAQMLPSEVDAQVNASLRSFSETNPTEHGRMQAEDLRIVRVPYVVIALVVLAVLVMFAVTKMPHTGHTEEPIHIKEVLRNLASFRYIGGVVAQCFYVGAQIMCWTFIIHYGMTLLGMSAATAQNWNIVAMAVFISSRFAGTLFFKFKSPGLPLSAGTILLQGMPGMWCLVAISACMSIMFPTIYGIALDGLTVDDAKLGSAGLIFAIVGGAAMPPLQGAIIDMPSFTIGPLTLESVRVSFFLPLLCFVVVAAYGLTVHWMDTRRARLTQLA